MSNKYPKVFMKDVFDVISVKEQSDFLRKVRRVLERSLLDYYASFSQNRIYVFAVDPVTSAQMARYNYQLLLKKVHQILPEWLEENSCGNFHGETFNKNVEKKLEKITFYYEFLKQTSWYHFCVRAKIKENIEQLEYEEISLQCFVCLILFLNVSRYQASSDWHELLRH